MLRIHDRRVLRREAEEVRVELIDVREHRPRAHVVRIGQQLRRFARPGQLLVRKAVDGFNALAARLRQNCVQIRGARKAPRHADDGDLGSR